MRASFCASCAESVVAGIGLSVLGMIAAAYGYLTPVQGALLQEVIDVAVILNALRALRIAPRLSIAFGLPETLKLLLRQLLVLLLAPRAPLAVLRHAVVLVHGLATFVLIGNAACTSAFALILRHSTPSLSLILREPLPLDLALSQCHLSEAILSLLLGINSWPT